MSGTIPLDDAEGLLALVRSLALTQSDPLPAACAQATALLGACGCAVFAGAGGDTCLCQHGTLDGFQLSLPLVGVPGAVVFAYRERRDEDPAFHQRAEIVASLLGLGLARSQLARVLGLVERSKREWEAAFDAIAEGVAIVDLDCRVVRANWAFARLMGTTPQAVVGKRCEDLLAGDGAACEGCRAAATTLDDPSARFTREVKLDGRVLSVSVYPFTNSEKQAVGSVQVLRDVTEEKMMHETIVRTERLRALGEMATGVAHSFGNLLVSIGGWAEVLLGEGGEAVQRPANAILQASQDGAEAVRRLQNYARSQSAEPFQLVDLNAVVRDGLELSQPRYRPLSIRRGINYVVEVDQQPLPPVYGNAAELREVLVNLIFNAIDAMPGGGRLSVRTVASGREVRVEVKDDGVGMTPEVQARIFDPFFTTKGQGGSGLGLAIAYGIVERHGGRIEVASEPGKGSVFTVILPAAGKQGTRKGRSEVSGK